MNNNSNPILTLVAIFYQYVLYEARIKDLFIELVW